MLGQGGFGITYLAKQKVSVAGSLGTIDAEMEVTADTVAMSTPHEIEYTLNFDSSSMKKEEK